MINIQKFEKQENCRGVPLQIIYSPCLSRRRGHALETQFSIDASQSRFDVQHVRSFCPH